MWADRDAAGRKIVAVAGKAALRKLSTDDAYDAWARTRSMMSAVTNLDLGLDLGDRTGPGMLPVSETALCAALASFDLGSVVGPALTAFNAGVPTPMPTRMPAAAPATPVVVVYEDATLF